MEFLHTLWAVTFGGDMRWVIVVILWIVAVVLFIADRRERRSEATYLFFADEMDWDLDDEEAE